MALLFFLFLFLPIASALPSSTRTSSSASLSTPPHSPSNRPSSTHLPITHPHLPPPTTRHSIQIISRPTQPTNPIVPIPVHTHRPPPPPPSHSQQSTQKPISIAFEVLGGLFASLIIIGLIRCCYNYKKTPGRDRIADILHRHNLQRELEELERNPAVLRRPSLREPAPPYFPRPPSYEDMNPPQPVRSTPGSTYSAVATSSPPPSPPMSQRDLPGAIVTVRPHHDLIPQIPSG
ncbi:hypothetical protein CPB84DRAFT_1757496 [Gymnopilus junonius]|uniref:Transmembrane protein n=1 Tax=Gymnopilus junonius TaxID=109634 RepID=A0A9P5TUW0_GYMJU|nr:hypothetical protein CPB84DRAFT_1757496 [Gymnopilus junonius]